MTEQDYTADARWIGRQLRAAREQRGWILKDLADASGFTQGYLSKVERGASGLPIKTFLALSDVLGLNWPELVAARHEAHSSAKEEERPFLARPVLLGGCPFHRMTLGGRAFRRPRSRPTALGGAY